MFSSARFLSTRSQNASYASSSGSLLSSFAIRVAASSPAFFSKISRMRAAFQ